jgi:RimJ/RimL family protein N-acetyltransferase
MNPEIFSRGLRGENIWLIPMTPDHAAYVVAWRNRPENMLQFVDQTPLTIASHLKWLEARSRSTTEFNWMILTPDETPIGTISIYNIDWINRVGEFGRFLIGNDKFRGCGLGALSLASVLLLSKKAGLEAVVLEVKASNWKAVHLYEKMGFKTTKTGDMLTMSRCIVGFASDGG